MKQQRLWYVRRHGSVSGPFPHRLISQALLLGRFEQHDEASLDKVFWSPIGNIAELQPQIHVKHRVVGTADAPLDWETERIEAAKRWADERHREDRRDPGAAKVVDSNLRRRDRRMQEDNPEWAALRQRHAEWEAELKARRDRFFGVAMALILFLSLIAYAVLNFSTINPIKVDFKGPSVACTELAGPQVNWAGCDKNGAWLKGVNLISADLARTLFNAANLSHAEMSYANLTQSNLSFANLQQTKLISANLSSANLSYAELRDADLRYADLRGANLEAASLIGARFDHAIWVDGRVCEPISVGSCK